MLSCVIFPKTKGCLKMFKISDVLLKLICTVLTTEADASPDVEKS